MKSSFVPLLFSVLMLLAAACGSDDTPEPDTADDTVQTTDDSDGTDSTDDNSSSDDGDDTDDPASTLEIDYIDYYNSDEYGFTERYYRCDDSDLICRITLYDVSMFYGYDPSGRIIDIRISLDYGAGYKGSFTYADDRIATGYLRYIEDNYFYYEVNVDYASPESFTAVLTHRDPVTTEIISQTNYKINLTLDGQDRVVFFERTNLENSLVETLAFEYEAGNLTKMIIDGVEPGIVLEYDDSPNMYAVAPAVPFVGRRDLVISNELLDNLIYMPQMMNFRNANNPVRKYLNGSLVEELEYTYNEYGYIDTILYPTAPPGTYQKVTYIID